jgi:hypothetical protein
MLAATAALGVTLLAGVPAASAHSSQDGLVNVNAGDVTVLQDVNVGVGAQLAATLCGIKVGPVAVLGRAVDRSGETKTVCTTSQGPITLSQN